MSNTMEDLRQEVANRLRTALHGREIDMLKQQVEVPHMLGITPIGKIHDPQNEEMTLLDPSHQFWQDYHRPIKTGNAVSEEIETAIRSLRKDETFRITFPYGEEADIAYIEVDDISKQTNTLETTCTSCGESVEGVLSAVEDNGYSLRFDVACSNCGYAELVEL